MQSTKPSIYLTVTNDLNQDQRMHRICASLSSYGYDTSLVGRIKSDSLEFAPNSFKSKRLTCIFSKSALFYLEYNFKLLLLFFRMRPDIICAIDLDTIIAGRTYAFLFNKKFVFDAHEYFEELPELEGKKLRKTLWKMVSRFFLKGSKYNYTVNDSLRNILSEAYSIPFITIPNYPQKSDFVLTNSHLSKPVKLLYQGVLNEGRGLELLIELIENRDDLHLTLIGNGDLKPGLKELVNQKKLNHKIEFLGFVNPDKLRLLTPKYDLGLNLLESKSANYFYSSANKAYDYIMAGLPAINMDFPEYQKLNRAIPTSLLLNNLSLTDLNQAVDEFKNNPSLYEQYHQNCLVQREQLNWAKVEQNLISFYQQILE